MVEVRWREGFRGERNDDIEKERGVVMMVVHGGRAAVRRREVWWRFGHGEGDRGEMAVEREGYRGESITVISLKTQARYFKKVVAWLRQNLGNSDAKALLSNAVYMFSIGANDYISQDWTHSDVLNSYSHSEYVDMVIGNLTSIIKEIHRRGGRKFAFLNVPPIGCLPTTRIVQPDGEDKCAEALSSLASIHNETLYMALLKLEKQLRDFKFSLYDINADVYQMINHPLKYGLKEGKSACCGSGPFRRQYSCGGKRGEKHFELCDKPNEHLFWDSFHLTESSYKQIADRMWGYTKNSYTIGTYTINDLFKSSDYLCPDLSFSLS